jgi:hypothetical protein
MSVVIKDLDRAAVSEDHRPPVVVIGAGPAGLTAALHLTDHGRPVVVFEATDSVGGISQTVERHGWRFDIGGHRFFTKVPAVEAVWHRLLKDDDFPVRPRMSRIHYDGKFYDYPLNPRNALRNLGLVNAVLCVASYAWARVRPPRDVSYHHSMLTAIYAVENVVLGAGHDVWAVNLDDDYHEEASDSGASGDDRRTSGGGGRDAPRIVRPSHAAAQVAGGNRP